MGSSDRVSSENATYRQLVGVAEYRAFFVAVSLSSVGDMLTRVAIAILVFDRTGSSLLTAIAFAVSFLPNIVLGPLLAVAADRYPRKTVLVVCDVVRALLVGIVATNLLPLPLVFIFLFASGLVTFPAWAARSALLPSILPGDVYTLGLAVNMAMYQVSQIVGFALGGALVATFSAYGVLALDSGTFIVSAVLLAIGLRPRPALMNRQQRGTVTADTRSALSFVLGHRVLRHVLLVVWLSSAFAMSHEGLAPALASELGTGPVSVGFLLAASPVGIVIAGFVATRFMPPPLRLQLVPFLALLSCIAIIPVGFGIPLWAVLFCYFVSGLGMVLTITLNATYNRLIPSHLRGRAAGIAIAGLTIFQATAMIGSGFLAELIPPGWVVTGAGICGTLAILPLAFRWPSAKELTIPLAAPDPGTK